MRKSSPFDAAVVDALEELGQTSTNTSGTSTIPRNSSWPAFRLSAAWPTPVRN